MPNIDKVKKTKKKKTKKPTNLPVAAKKTKTATKKNAVAYFNCLLTSAQQN
jgi:hypothetical protein